MVNILYCPFSQTSSRTQHSNVKLLPSLGRMLEPKLTYEVPFVPPSVLTAYPLPNATKDVFVDQAVCPPTLSVRSPLKLQRWSRRESAPDAVIAITATVAKNGSVPQSGDLFLDMMIVPFVVFDGGIIA